jgi:hypothetical protein
MTQRIKSRLAVGVLLSFLTAGGAVAQNELVPPAKDGPFSGLSRSLKFRHEPSTPPDWVVKTRRPDQESFMPTGAAARTEPAKPMSLEKLREVERSLDAERARHDRLGRRNAVPSGKTVAIGPVAKKKAAKRPCALTCASPIGSQRKR